MTMRQQARFSSGRVVVATSALGLLFGAFPIVVSSFAIFFPSYLREFHASRAAISLALTTHNLLAALLAGCVGRLADRFGARKLILPGLGILGLVLLSAKAIGSSVWQLYVFYAMLGVVSDTTTAVPYCLVVSRWFNRHRGLALGLTLAGMGVGAMVMPLVMHQLIAVYGWRSALAIAGAAILIVPMPIVGLFLKEAPRHVSLAADRAAGQPEGLTWPEIRSSPAYWLMTAAFVLTAGSIHACIVHMAQIFSDRGAPGASAALAVSVGGLALLAGRAGTGFFLDRYFGPHVAMSVFTMAALGIALLRTGATGLPAFVGTFLLGLGFGAEGDIMAYLVSRYFGLRSLGAAFGFSFGAYVLAGGLGPLLMGFAFDHTGSYRAPLGGCLIATLAAVAQMSRLGPYRFAATRHGEAPAEIQSGVEA